MFSWKRSTCLLLTVAFLWSPAQSLAADAAAATVAADETEIDLYSLSDAELEEICTVRGFELVHDEENKAFTHDDYVEAARQCLAIERDMEDIIAEYPEILNELEEERDRMMAEKERLEQELAEAEKRANGRQLPHEDGTQQHHAAFVSHTEQPEEVLDFDVIGHQEPLSDSRVHEDAATNTDDDSSLTTQNDERNPLSLRETIRAFQDRFVRDFNAVADIVFPKSMRGPSKDALLKIARIAKREAINVYKFVMRYIKAFIERRKNQTDQESGEAAMNGIGGTESQETL